MSGRMKLVACAECYTVKAVHAKGFGTHIRCAVCNKMVERIPLDVLHLDVVRP